MKEKYKYRGETFGDTVSISLGIAAGIVTGFTLYKVLKDTNRGLPRKA
jgi:hypothetical protein